MRITGIKENLPENPKTRIKNPLYNFIIAEQFIGTRAPYLRRGMVFYFFDKGSPALAKELVEYLEDLLKTEPVDEDMRKRKEQDIRTFNEVKEILGI